MNAYSRGYADWVVLADGCHCRGKAVKQELAVDVCDLSPCRRLARIILFSPLYGRVSKEVWHPNVEPPFRRRSEPSALSSRGS